MKYEGFRLDAHAHVMDGASGVKKLLQTEKEYGYDSCCALGAVAWGGAAHNAQCLLVKHSRPDCYVFAGMNHAEGDFYSQCRNLVEMGADGFKMIEGKPDAYRLTGHPLDSLYYDGLYRFAQENNFPILAHVGDPPECWDLSKATDFAVENGWTYTDGTYPALEELFDQVDHIASRYPDLSLILAHFFFHSHQMDRAAAFLDRHPNVCFDICPGTEMYENFSRNTAEARDFFLRYQDRLIFGTDNWDTEDRQEKKDKDEINRMIHSFLQTGDTFPVWDHTMKGIDLPVPVLEKIYFRNFQRLAGEKHSPLSQSLLAAHCQDVLSAPERFGARPEDMPRLASVLEALKE